MLDAGSWMLVEDPVFIGDEIMIIERIVKKLDLEKDSSIKEDLAYWLSKKPQDRIAAIEFLRRQYHGSSERLQRSARVIQQKQG